MVLFVKITICDITLWNSKQWRCSIICNYQQAKLQCLGCYECCQSTCSTSLDGTFCKIIIWNRTLWNSKQGRCTLIYRTPFFEGEHVSSRIWFMSLNAEYDWLPKLTKVHTLRDSQSQPCAVSKNCFVSCHEQGFKGEQCNGHSAP